VIVCGAEIANHRIPFGIPARLPDAKAFFRVVATTDRPFIYRPAGGDESRRSLFTFPVSQCPHRGM
jgi:hypothetical protein